MKYKILAIDDDEKILRLIANALKANNFHVETRKNIEEINICDFTGFDLILLDVMMPISGLEICRSIRSQITTPILFLTAKDFEEDLLKGIQAGADDYITKPFNILEVKARIKAIMRRTAASQPKKEDSKVIEAGDLKLDCESRRLFILGKEVNLTAKEFDLLELLVNNPNKVYGRENLLNLVWGYEYPGDVRTVDVHVRRLREKIESNPSEPKYVHTKPHHKAPQ